MAQRVLKVRNGVRLIEATLVGISPPRILSYAYTVKRKGLLEPVYKGPSISEAWVEFEKAAG